MNLRAFVVLAAHVRYDKLADSVTPRSIYLREDDAIELVKSFEQSGEWRNVHYISGEFSSDLEVYLPTTDEMHSSNSTTSYLDHAPLS